MVKRKDRKKRQKKKPKKKPKNKPGVVTAPANAGKAGKSSIFGPGRFQSHTIGPLILELEKFEHRFKDVSEDVLIIKRIKCSHRPCLIMGKHLSHRCLRCGLTLMDPIGCSLNGCFHPAIVTSGETSGESIYGCKKHREGIKTADDRFHKLIQNVVYGATIAGGSVISAWAINKVQNMFGGPK